MKPTQSELGLVGLLIVYIAFFTHPAPSHLVDLLSTPVGHTISLLGILYVTVYQSLLVGVFLGIAYIMTAQQVTEYLDPKEQTPTEKKEQPKSAMVPEPPAIGVLKSVLEKGDRLPSVTQKKGTPTEKPTSSTHAKPSAPKTLETFASF